MKILKALKGLFTLDPDPYNLNEYARWIKKLSDRFDARMDFLTGFVDGMNDRIKVLEAAAETIRTAGEPVRSEQCRQCRTVFEIGSVLSYKCCTSIKEAMFLCVNCINIVDAVSRSAGCEHLHKVEGGKG